MELYEDREWDDYKNMTTGVEGMEHITYEEKRLLAEKEVMEYISDCADINEAASKIRNDEETFESGRLYLGWAVVAVVGDVVWWATRND